MSNTVVNTNVLAINSHRNLKSVGTEQSKASQRLSSGLRINSAADDAAGLAISEKMRAQIRGMEQASTNSQDGISLLQTAEGGLQEIDSMLQRVRELVVQASNDTNDYNSNDRTKIQDEIEAMMSEIDSMQNRVEFNNKKVINGSAQDKGAALDKIAREISDYGSYNGVKTTSAGTVATKLKKSYDNNLIDPGKISWGNISTVYGSIASLGKVTKNDLHAALVANDLNLLNTMVEDINKALDSLAGSSENSVESIASSELSKLKDGILEYRKVFAEKLMRVAQETELGNLPSNSTPLFLQVGANADQSIQINIGGVNTAMLNIGSGTGTSWIDVKQESGSKISAQLDTIDAALSYITTQRSKLGATQNRLEYTINSLDISGENLTAAESRIRDADMAKEMMNLTKSNVLQQAATSMLAQANQAPQNVLQLLQGS